VVAHTDLAQLDPALELRREVAHQVAEVDAMLGGEVERDAVAAERHLDLGEVHLELAQLDPLLAVLERFALADGIVIELVQVLLGHLADDLARHVARTLELDQRRILEEDGAGGLAVFALHDDVVAQTEPEFSRVEEEFLARPAQGDLDDLRHRSLYRRPGRPPFTPASAGESFVAESGPGDARCRAALSGYEQPPEFRRTNRVAREHSTPARSQ